MNDASSTPAGWYPDPSAPGQLGYWNGSAWTGHHAPANPAASAPLKAPAGTQPYTPYIWLIVLLPLIPLVLVLFVPWASMFDIDLRLYENDPSQATLQMYAVLLSPAYWLSAILGLVVYVLNVVFAYLDHKALLARGVQRPFHWAFGFLSSVYPIGRTIVAARRIGRGWAPLWVEGGVIAAALVVSGVVTAQITAATLEFVREVSLYAGR